MNMAARPAVAPHVPYTLRGVGPFTHKEPRNWPAEIFGGINTLHFAENCRPWPVVAFRSRARPFEHGAAGAQ